MSGVKGRSGGKKMPIDDRMRGAAQMSAQGESYTKIAKQYNVSLALVSRWFDREDVRELRSVEITKMLNTMLGKAYAVLSAQLADENQWIRQGAAREIIRICERQQQIDDATIEVEFMNMPTPGAPQSAEDDKEASEILEVDEID